MKQQILIFPVAFLLAFIIGGQTFAMALSTEISDSSSTQTQVIFSDVNSSTSYAQDILWGYNTGLLKGTGQEMFSPDQDITRASFVVILHRYDGELLLQNSNPFDDVLESAYYRDAVVWAFGKKIINGTENDSFSPDENLTREQAAVILMNYFIAKGYTRNSASGGFVFDDADKISLYAKKAVLWAQTSGLYISSSPYLLELQHTVSRAEATALIHQFDLNLTDGYFE